MSDPNKSRNIRTLVHIIFLIYYFLQVIEPSPEVVNIWNEVSNIESESYIYINHVPDFEENVRIFTYIYIIRRLSALYVK